MSFMKFDYYAIGKALSEKNEDGFLANIEGTFDILTHALFMILHKQKHEKISYNNLSDWSTILITEIDTPKNFTFDTEYGPKSILSKFYITFSNSQKTPLFDVQRDIADVLCFLFLNNTNPRQFEIFFMLEANGYYKFTNGILHPIERTVGKTYTDKEVIEAAERFLKNTL